MKPIWILLPPDLFSLFVHVKLHLVDRWSIQSTLRPTTCETPKVHSLRAINLLSLKKMSKLLQSLNPVDYIQSEVTGGDGLPRKIRALVLNNIL